MLMKSEGKKLEGDKTIERLVETRTVLEKMRPVDMKIRYQVDKLIKTATSGEIAPNDPRRFKPNPDNLVSKVRKEKRWIIRSPLDRWLCKARHHTLPDLLITTRFNSTVVA